MKRIALYTAIILTTAAVVAILISFPEAVVLFLVSLSIAAALRPMVDSLVQRGVVRGLAVVISYLTVIIVIVVLVQGISGPLFSELAKLGDHLAIAYDRIWSTWPKGTQIQQTIIRQLPEPESLYSGITGDKGAALANTLMGITSSSFATLSQVFGSLVLSIYWTIDRIHFERLWLSLLAVETRARGREIGREIENDLGAYIRSEVIQSLLAGLVLGAGFYWMGLPYPTLLALFAALAWLIPWLGGPLAVLIVLGAAWLSSPPLLAAGAAVLAAAVFIALELFVEPRLFRRRAYSPWLAIVFIMALSDAFGLAGVIIAPPLAAITQMVVRRIMQETTPVAAPVGEEIESARKIAKLDERVEAVRVMVDQMPEKPAPQTANMLDRLNALIDKANQMIE